MGIVSDLIPFSHSKISGIAVYNSIVLTNQFCCLINIVNIGSGRCNGMDIACPRIYAGMHFHAEMPLVAFLGLMHFRVAFVGSIPG